MTARVLIVEDNERNMKLFRDLLEFAGFRILQAGTGAAALAVAATEAPDLVLMDVQLPDMDGVAALQRLRADAATAGLTVIALTSFAMAGDRERFLAAGFDGYLSKPIDIKTFPEQVRQFCAVRRP